MTHWIQKIFSNVKVQRQLFILFVLAFSLPVLLIGTFLIINTKKTITNHYIEQTEAENIRVKSILFDVTTNIYNISEDFVLNSELQSILSYQFKDTNECTRSISNYEQFDTILARDTSISTIKLYTPNETIHSFGNFVFADLDITNTTWYQKSSVNAGIFWVTKSRTDRGNEYHELTMYRKLPVPSAHSFAILEITVSSNYIKNRIQNNTLKTMTSVNQDSIFYSATRADIGRALPIYHDDQTPYYQAQGIIPIDNKDYIGSVTTLHPYRSDDNIYIVSYSEQALPYVNNLTLKYCLIVFLALLFPCFIIYTFSNYFSTRVNILRNSMQQASKGDYNIIDTFHGKDELSETFRNLKLMIDDIKKKEAKIYQTQIKEQQLENHQQEIEFKMLASQINPHFLYNTLETIRMKAFTCGNTEVATAIKLLGRSLHYVLENTGTASTLLAKELSYIDTYLNIQRLRFNNRVNYTLEVQEDLKLTEYQILPLLLQPLVENAIIHGLEGIDSNGQIRINIYTELNCYLCICVTDNGMGMEAEELRMLQKAILTMDTTRTKSIGLYNINQRIKLCYGSEYGIHISSDQGKGTRVLIKLPIDKLKVSTSNF